MMSSSCKVAPWLSPIKGKVAVVAGATRSSGRGIACMLGEAGATVYCTGRTVRGRLSPIGRQETIEETAEMVTARGGVGIWVQVDHTQPDQVQALFERVKTEQNGCKAISKMATFCPLAFLYWKVS